MGILDAALSVLNKGRIQSVDRRARLQKAAAAAAMQSLPSADITQGGGGGGPAYSGAVGPGQTVKNFRGDPVNLSRISFGNGRSTLINSQYASQFQGLVNDLAQAGYRINTANGYQDRRVAGTNTASKHALGLAIDINSAKNPYTNKLITEFNPNVIRQILSKYPAIEWGGFWKGKKDAMHFSVKQRVPGYSGL